MKTSVMAVLVVMVVAAGAAQAKPAEPVKAKTRATTQGWAVISDQTVGVGANAVHAQLGFPGVSVAFLHGLQDNLDVGLRATGNYSYEGLVKRYAGGVKAEAIGRLRFLDTASFGLTFNFGLGYLQTWAAGGLEFGALTLPLGLTVGIPIGSALVASFGLDLPLFLTFDRFNGGLTAPILAGFGLEYFLDRSLAVTLNTRVGPALNPTVLVVGTSAELALQVQLGVAFKL